MEAEPAIQVSNLGKVYKIYHRDEKATTAAEALVSRIRNLGGRSSPELVHAVEDLNFRIAWGEAVGILGRNGSGKSTLLKLITRVTAPSSGRIELRGRVGSLLEVGTGFHAELTGRENVFLNGTLLGMRRREIRARFDEIVDFAGVEQYLDTQVKRYSSGMYVRLAFAVAAHLDADILAVDEVLAVGDMAFQAKCLQRMREVSQQGRCVLYVSHQLQTVSDLCTSAIYLDSGKLAYNGGVEDAMEIYKQSFQSEGIATNATKRPGSGELRFASAQMSGQAYDPAETKVLTFEVDGNPTVSGDFYVRADVVNERGVVVFQCDSRLVGATWPAHLGARGRLTIESPWMIPGFYSVNLILLRTGKVDTWAPACTFHVVTALPYEMSADTSSYENGATLADFSFESE